MAEFIVVDVNAEQRLIALLDRSGRYHVALATAGVPPIRAYVRGFNPERGFGLLVEVQTGQVHRIVFEAVDCGQEQALERLHEGVPAAWPMRHVSAATPAPPFRASRSQDQWDLLAPERRADRVR